MQEQVAPSTIAAGFGAAPAQLYLPQLDGLRFVAFFMVLLHHNATPRDYFAADSGFGKLLWLAGDWGFVGVDVFLTLSSFLIVTLLMMERNATGSISIKQFYIRRALRIWPLYYGYLLLAMVLLPLVWAMPQPLAETLGRHLFPFLTFTGNFSYAYFPAVQYAGHLWTISTEEQFYLMVPILVMFSPRVGKLLIAWGIGLLFFTAISNFRSEEHTSELQSQSNLVCRLLLEKKKNKNRVEFDHVNVA